MKRSVSKNRDLHGNVPDHCSAALVLVDVLNDLDFPGGNTLVSIAETLAGNISALKRRCQAARIPAIYVNDNRRKWRSDSATVIKHCLRAGAPGRALVEPVVGEFPKRTEFLRFFGLIPSGACATFSLFFCMPSSPSSGLLNPVASGPLSPVPTTISRLVLESLIRAASPATSSETPAHHLTATGCNSRIWMSQFGLIPIDFKGRYR
jgi:hypothetical protein